MIKSFNHMRGLVYPLILFFFILVSSEAFPKEDGFKPNKENNPVVRVKEGGKRLSAAQKEAYVKAFFEGKRLLEEEMDYTRAIQKFLEAEMFAETNELKSEVYYYLSRAYFAWIGPGSEEFVKVIEKLIEVDYYRELNKRECSPQYIELFQQIKKKYGALKILSKPTGAEVYIDNSKSSEGITPLTIGHKAGVVIISLKKEKKKKEANVKVRAGKETQKTYTLKRGKGFFSAVLALILLAAAAVGAYLLTKNEQKEGLAQTLDWARR